MRFKELELKVRKNKKTGSLDVNLPKKKFSVEELDKIQEEGIIKIFMRGS